MAARIEDLWIRRISGVDDSGAPQVADFLYVAQEGGRFGLWGPTSPVQSQLILACLRESLLGVAVAAAFERLAAARATRHATGFFAMAVTACDLALWDLRGQEAEVPVYRLLGRPRRKQVQCYASLLGFDVFAPLASDFVSSLASIYWGLKWAARLGPEAGASGRTRTVQALAWIQEAGAGRLMVDALTLWTADHTLAFLRECAAAGVDVTWLEEPVRPRDLVAYRRITGATPTCIAAGEHAYEPLDVCNLIDCGVGAIQPDAGWCGGLLAFDDAIRHAGRSGVRVFPHGGGLLPALHVSLHHPETVVPALEYHLTMEPVRQFFWADKVAPSDGWLSAPDRAGLGLVVDEQRVTSSRDLRHAAGGAS